jgi:hypothetical protein
MWTGAKANPIGTVLQNSDPNARTSSDYLNLYVLLLGSKIDL